MKIKERKIRDVITRSIREKKKREEKREEDEKEKIGGRKSEEIKT